MVADLAMVTYACEPYTHVAEAGRLKLEPSLASRLAWDYTESMFVWGRKNIWGQD